MVSDFMQTDRVYENYREVLAAQNLATEMLKVNKQTPYGTNFKPSLIEPVSPEQLLHNSRVLD
jgi:hypothetical protein